MVLSVVVFDFDRTIIDDDSDRWVINQMGLTNLFNQLRTTLPWTSLMDTIMQHLHSNGITIDNIAQSLKTAFLHPNIVSAIKSAHSLGLIQTQHLLMKRVVFMLLLFMIHYHCLLMIVTSALPICARVWL
ncbi:hypothetical protein KIW84_070580 [Lathyrus oleraceus]|uniref:Uncharacterized protein n=1 Tax=Pisum sativum TaxID=3888 RepID=A0A9D4ZUR8_PEA|nr:hypothetical protein KIW84_070580 [Pisum sativum]